MSRRSTGWKTCCSWCCATGPARLAAIIIDEIGAQAAVVLEVFWILRPLELFTPAIYPLVIESATKFITMVFFFVPLQVGAAEGSYAVIFGALGLPASAIPDSAPP